MKKLFKLFLLAFTLVLVFAFSGCVVSLTCISHIDRNNDGKCDNCKKHVTIVSSNVKSVSVKTAPSKLYYAFNEELDIAGGVLTVVYNDGTPSADILFTAAGVTVTAPGMGSEGEKSVAVSYGGKRTTYTIEVGAARFTVSFDLGYQGGTPIPAQVVTVGGHASAPATPVRTGYDFAGWYTDNTYTTAFDFDMHSVTANITVHVKWVGKFTVTYSANFTGGAAQTAETVLGKADSTIVPLARAGYTFSGWYTEPECIISFSFDTNLTADKTLYAQWVSDVVPTHTVTFNHNYGATPTTTTSTVPEGSRVATPASPARANVSTKGHQSQGFTFGGWYTDKECVAAYGFTNAVTADITLYAKWTGTYIFEAEHVSLTDRVTGEPLRGMGASGGSEGPNMVDPPAPGMEGINASNGYYVTYLYAPFLALYFDIDSDRDVADATLIFRISAENVPFALSSYSSDIPTESGTILSEYLIKLNDAPIDYGVIEITDVTGHAATGGRRPFSDFTIAVSLSLTKGRNTFSFTTANTNGMGGTMSATAPVIDCIKVTTSANLEWTALLDNEFGQ